LKTNRLNWLQLILLFGIPTALNYLACRIAIPYFNKDFKYLPIEIVYFICVGAIVLIPLFIGAIYLTIKEIDSVKIKDILFRMRIKKLSAQDLVWTVSGFIILSMASFMIAKLILPLFNIDASPFFFKNMPLGAKYFWVIYVWPVFFFFNIFGEEFLWRGYIQPKQELLNRNWTWLVHGILWALFHLPMGINLVLSAIPIFFILPGIVQIRKNTTISIIIHFVFGAFGFWVLALGAVE
jgi:membrane protease YdiL (CAAX protease family)